VKEGRVCVSAVSKSCRIIATKDTEFICEMIDKRNAQASPASSTEFVGLCFTFLLLSFTCYAISILALLNVHAFGFHSPSFRFLHTASHSRFTCLESWRVGGSCECRFQALTSQILVDSTCSYLLEVVVSSSSTTRCHPADYYPS
jgi:hypothetical protein